jgi:deoxyadenosine/deoxycytidine kinase
MNIDEQYLSSLNEKYEEWINNIYKGRVLIVDKDVDDFVANPEVVDRICEQLEQMARK